jgi:hypothetical protein
VRPTFEDKFPEITFTDEEWNSAVGLYPCFYGAEWDTSPCDDNVILHLLAHLIITIQHQQGKTGASVGVIDGGRTQSKSVGNVSVSYAITPFTTEQELKYGAFMTTSYGKMYLTLLNSINHYGGVFV